MDTIFYIILGVLFILAIGDLIVGVGNDAVNFLNSAIGSKSVPFWVTMTVASLGVFIGATFSDGMMEVARNGIFHPQMFYFGDIMILFVAVMLTDVLLLDIFNTFGLPTSTTVSLVFELLGAAVGVAIIKVKNSPTETLADLSNYINSEKALGIISGILLSVVLAFVVGLIVQYISRFIFTFNYVKTIKYFGALWGGIAITGITFFILVKGAKDASFMTAEAKDWIKDNSFLIILYSFIGWTVLMQLLTSLFKVNILKIIIMIGTFALAMAFAGNDLVNFIGVPLAGIKSFEIFNAAGGDPYAFTMESLSEKVQTPTLFLLFAGLIMVLTLWFSKKAKTVTETEVSLARQDEGVERFGSTGLSRSIVRGFVNFSRSVEKVMPAPVFNFLSARFDQRQTPKVTYKNSKDVPAFDLVRASVNLAISSMLIAFGTSMKLPLSTTYVTFMVAMGTSLADGAWGRESAVYRVTGVISVIGGWFLTAFVAFTVACTFAILIHWGGMPVLILLIILSVGIFIKSRLVHDKRVEAKLDNIGTEIKKGEDNEKSILDMCINQTSNMFNSSLGIFESVITGLSSENRRALRDAKTEADIMRNTASELKLKLPQTIKALHIESIEIGQYYVQMVDYLREFSNCWYHIVSPSYEHINNNHKGIKEVQQKELTDLYALFSDMFAHCQTYISENDYSKIEIVEEKQQLLMQKIEEISRLHLKRIKYEQAGTKSGVMYMTILSELKNSALFVVHLFKAQKEFVNFANTKISNLA